MVLGLDLRKDGPFGVAQLLDKEDGSGGDTLADGLWLDLAKSANARCVQLAEGLRGHNAVTMLFEPQANIIFFNMPRREHKRMLDAGAVYYVMSGDPDVGDPEEELMGRLVTDWSMTQSGVDQFLDLLRG